MLGKRGARASGLRAPSKSVVPKKKARNVDYKPTFRLSVMKNPHSNAFLHNLRCKMIYVEPITLNPAAASVATYVFSANGLYDPNITGSGHQPTGFDQMTALYGEYVVVGANCKVTFQNTATTAGTACMFGVYLSRTTSTASIGYTYLENGNCVYTTAEYNGTGSSVKVLNYSCDMSKEASTDITKDEGYSGTGSANPAEQRFFFVWACPLDFASDLGAQTALVEITYDVIWRDRQNTDTS